MGPIVLKTKNKVTNLDSLHAKDAYAKAYLQSFDILNYTYKVEYKAEIIYNEGGQDQHIDMQILRSITAEMEPSDIQALFDATGSDIAQGENFQNEMRTLLTTAFLYQVGQDGWFGLTANDWEVVL